MASRSGIDGYSTQAHLFEIKGASTRRAPVFRLRWIHGLMAVCLLSSAAIDPRFLLTFLLMIFCVSVSLVGFVFLVQLPVRLVAGHLKNIGQASSAARTRSN